MRVLFGPGWRARNVLKNGLWKLWSPVLPIAPAREAASLSRQHNDANVLALGERLIDRALALTCTEAFLGTAFEGGRHQRRVDKLAAIGNDR